MLMREVVPVSGFLTPFPASIRFPPPFPPPVIQNNKKVFIRGLSWTATRDQVVEAFSRYGKIADVCVVMDKVTGRNKGFGFVAFEEAYSAYKCLENPEITIDVRHPILLLLLTLLVSLLSIAAPK